MENGSLTKEIDNIKVRILDLIREESKILKARSLASSSFGAQVKVVRGAIDKLVGQLEKLEVEIISDSGVVVIDAATGGVAVDAEASVEGVAAVATSQ